jgi:hypothetical protein
MLLGVGAEFEGLLREIGEPASEHVLPPPPKSPPDMAKLSAIADKCAYHTSLGPRVHPPGDQIGSGKPIPTVSNPEVAGAGLEPATSGL